MSPNEQNIVEKNTRKFIQHHFRVITLHRRLTVFVSGAKKSDFANFKSPVMYTNKHPTDSTFRIDLNYTVPTPTQQNIRETQNSSKHILNASSTIIEKLTMKRFRNKLPYFSQQIPILMIKKKLQNTLTLAKVNLGTLEKKEVFCRDQKMS